MPEYQRATIGGILNQGKQVPVVTFYSASDGVVKSTLAQKLAELVTKAPGLEGRKPNVLLVDLDMQSQGLTFRVTQGLGRNDRTVHDVISERNVAAVRAIPLTSTGSTRGQLYLMPAAHLEAKNLFSTMAEIDPNELFRLLQDMINTLVMEYDILRVVMDCAPGANPYSAAAATLADVPLLIGRNEYTTYAQIQVLPERFREYYDQFQPATQRVIINAMSVKALYDLRTMQYHVFAYVPLTTDLIPETEGLSMAGSMRMLLFEKHIVDIIKQIFVGMDHLIPKTPDVIGQEWIKILNKLKRCEEAPKVRQLRLFCHLRWVGIGLVVSGIMVLGLYQILDDLPTTLPSIGIVCASAGIFLNLGGWYAESKCQLILTTAWKLIIGGADGVIEKIKEGALHRRELEEMKKLADMIPDETR